MMQIDQIGMAGSPRLEDTSTAIDLTIETHNATTCQKPAPELNLRSGIV
jgi:hypothetical protein